MQILSKLAEHRRKLLTEEAADVAIALSNIEGKTIDELFLSLNRLYPAIWKLEQGIEKYGSDQHTNYQMETFRMLEQELERMISEQTDMEALND